MRSVGGFSFFQSAAQRFDNPTRLSFVVPEAREDRLAVIKELVEDYPGDGIELNLHDYAPFIARREVAEHTATMTAWLKETVAEEGCKHTSA